MILLSFSRDSIWWSFYKCNCYVRVIGVSSTASNIQFHSWHTLQVRVCMYIWDCTWARPTMRACIELFILARKKKRKRKEKERERDIQRLLSHSRLCLLLCLCCLFYLLNSLFFSFVEEEIPVFHGFPSSLGFFSLSIHTYRLSSDQEATNEKVKRLDPPQSIRVTLSSKKYPRIMRFTRDVLSFWQDSICDNAFFE